MSLNVYKNTDFSEIQEMYKCEFSFEVIYSNFSGFRFNNNVHVTSATLYLFKIRISHKSLKSVRKIHRKI